MSQACVWVCVNCHTDWVPVPWDVSANALLYYYGCWCSYVLTCLVVITDNDEWVDAGVTLSTACEQHHLKLEVSWVSVFIVFGLVFALTQYKLVFVSHKLIGLS